MLLFWQTLKNIFKQKAQLTIFIILAALLTLLATSSWIVNTRLTNAYSFMGQETFAYDYLVRFDGKKKTGQNVETITPWFAFSNDYHLITDVNGKETTLPYVHFGINGALKPLDNQNVEINFTYTSTNKISNISFKDLNSNAPVFLNNGLYRFNYQSQVFQESLIGQLYNKNGNLFDHNNISLIEEFMNNFTRSDISQNTINLIIMYLNQKFSDPESTGTDKLREEVIKFVNPNNIKWEKNVDLRKGNPASIPEMGKIESELFAKGLSGDLSFLGKDTSQPLIKIGLYYSPTIGNNLDVWYNNNIQNAAFSVNDFYNKNNKNNLFKNQPYGPYGFTKSYYALVAKVSNFSYQLREQYEYWDLISNLKYKIINWQQLLETNQLKLIQKYSSFDPTNQINDVYIVITPQFASSQKLKVGDAIKVGENSNFFVGAIGGDPANIYPTIYDTDVFPDPATDGIIYVSNNIYRGETIIANTEIEENSSLYITHIGQDKKADVATFKKYLATDFQSLNSPTDQKAPLQSRDDTRLVYLRHSLLGITIRVYRTITIVLSVIFLIILIFTLVILIKKIINQQKIENGILKANGYSGLTIASSYLAHAIVVTGIGVPIGWLIGILLQFPIMSVFNNYFVIPTNSSFSLIPFIICFGIIGFVSILSILITAMQQLIISPLELLNPNKNIKTSKLVYSISNKFSFKKFTTKFRFVMMAVSMKKIGWFSLTFFIASLSLTFATLIPTAINKFSKDYYANLNYSNQYDYSNVIGNIPFSRYEMYDWNGPGYFTNPTYPIAKNSLISDYLYNNATKKWLSTKTDINADNAHLYAQQLNNMIIFNFMVGKGASLSIGTFYDMYTRYGENVDIRNQIDTLLCSTMPRAFGKKPVYPTDSNVVDRWTYCTQYATNDIMPGKIRAMWLKNELAKQQFNFTFGTSTYNVKDEDVYTTYMANILDSSFGLSTYGINANNKTIIFPNQTLRTRLDDSKDLNVKLDVIPMVINKAAESKYNLHLNEIVNTTTNVKQLKYCEGQNNCAVQKAAWGYELPNGFVDENVNPFTLDLTKLTIGKENRFGFAGQNKSVQDYYNVKNFVLKLPVNAFKDDEFKNTTISATTGRTLPGLLDPNPAEKDQQVVKKVGDYYIINPFDTKFDKEISGIGDLVSGFPTNWYLEALRQGLLKIGTVNNNVKYQIIGIQNSYDEPRAYVNQILANKILGFDTSSSQMYETSSDNPLLWFNGKFSKYQDQVDQTTRFNLSSPDGSYSMINFMNGQLSEGIGAADYLNIKAQVIQKLAVISSILSVIFVIITTITAIIIVYIMTESFVNTFLKFIAVMKALGYSNREINSLTLGIFTPFAFLAWILGVAIMWLILWLGVYGFTSIAKIIIPFGFPWLALPITFVLMAGIYLVTYWVSTYKINHMSIQEQINANEI